MPINSVLKLTYNILFAGLGNITDTLFAALFSAFYEYSPSVVGIAHHELAQSLNVYPNPNNGSFQIGSEIENLNDYKVEVLNQLGQIVYEFGPQKEQSQKSLAIQMEAPKTGVYYVRISDGNRIRIVKFVVW